MTTADETLYFDLRDYFQAIIQDIEQSRVRVGIQFYIFEWDALGQRIIEALDGAVARGVEASLLVDGFGSFNSIRELEKECLLRGIRFKVYHPIRWPFRHANHRNHVKLVVIDQRITYVGSFNASLQYLGWRDSGVRKVGRIGEDVNRLDLQLWEKRRGRRHPHFWSQGLHFNGRGKIRRRIYHEFLERIIRAQTRVWLTTAYLVPRRTLLQALEFAARRRVDVRILIPQKSDVWLERILSDAYASWLVRKGVRVFRYEAAILHSKEIMIDEWATVGSMNLNHRSFLHDLELNLELESEDSKATIRKRFEDDLNRSTEVSIADLEARPLFYRILTRLLLFFRRWA